MKNLLTKEEFVYIIEEVKVSITYVEELNKFNSKYGAEGYIFPPDCVASTLRLLKIMLNDTNDFISDFVFELNFGKKWKPGTITEKDGTDIKLETVDDLYALLVEEKE